MDEPRIRVEKLDMIFGTNVVQQNVSFSVTPGEIFVIMGGSGCGKSTLLRHMIGLLQPAGGRVLYDGESYWDAAAAEQLALNRRFGVLFQSGALWSSMTLAENVALPLKQYTPLSAADIARVVSLKLALVGLRGFEDFFPSEISGGMRKRAGLARAMALDPDILFFDEPSAGLDPLSSRRLDELISGIARQPGSHGRDGHARAAEYLRDRRQLGVSRRGDEDGDCLGQSAGTCEELSRSQGPCLPRPRRRRPGGHGAGGRIGKREQCPNRTTPAP